MNNINEKQKPQIDQKARANLIANHPFFSKLPSHVIDDLSNLMTEISFHAGEKIVNEGDVVDSIYLIYQGKCEVIKKQVLEENKSENLIVAVIGEGASIGLSDTGLFAIKGRRSATVIALTEIILLCIDIITFKTFLTTHAVFDSQFNKNIEVMFKLDFIKKIPPFVNLDNESLFNLTNKVNEIEFTPNTIIFNQGDVADCCYLIQEGSVEFFISELDGSERKVALLSSQDLFGEAALLSLKGVRNASARCVDKVKLLELKYNFLFDALKNNKNFNGSLLSFMVRRFCPVRRKEVVFYHQLVNGQAVIVLHNTETNRYYRLSEEDFFIWNELDGIQTVKSLTGSFFKKYKAFAPDMICNLLYSLAETGFVDIPAIKEDIGEVENLSGWQRILKKIKKITDWEFSFNHANRYLNPIYQYGIFIFYTWPLQLLLLTLISIGFFAFIYDFTDVIKQMNVIKLHFAPFIFLFFFISICTVILHELGHAFTAKKFGYKVRRFAIGWLGLGPIAYADTSELWLADRHTRIWVNIAGVYVDFLVASCIALAAHFIKNPVLFLYFWIFSLLIYYQGFKNLSPLNDYDGYYLLTDWVDSANLRESATIWLANTMPNIIFKPNEWSAYKNEMFYWLASITYLVVAVLALFFILELILNLFFMPTKYAIYFSLGIVAFILFITVYKLGAVIRHHVK